MKAELEYRSVTSADKVKTPEIERRQVCFILVTSRHSSVSAPFPSCAAEKVTVGFSWRKDGSSARTQLIASA